MQVLRNLLNLSGNELLAGQLVKGGSIKRFRAGQLHPIRSASAARGQNADQRLGSDNPRALAGDEILAGIIHQQNHVGILNLWELTEDS